MPSQGLSVASIARGEWQPKETPLPLFVVCCQRFLQPTASASVKLKLLNWLNLHWHTRGSFDAALYPGPHIHLLRGQGMRCPACRLGDRPGSLGPQRRLFARKQRGACLGAGRFPTRGGPSALQVTGRPAKVPPSWLGAHNGSVGNHHGHHSGSNQHTREHGRHVRNGGLTAARKGLRASENGRYQ